MHAAGSHSDGIITDSAGLTAEVRRILETGSVMALILPVRVSGYVYA